MHLSLLPFVILIALSIFSLMVWALICAIKEAGDKRRLLTRYTVVLIAGCTTLWLGVCFIFMVMASLGHSAHPIRDSWPQCIVSFLVIIIMPLALLLWRAKRRS